jgi:competence protein ComEC
MTLRLSVTLSMKWLDFTIIKLTCCLISGILIGIYYPIDCNAVLTSVGIGLVCWVVLFFFTDRKVKQPVLLGITTYILMISVGVFVVTFHTHKNHKNHYSKVIDFSIAQDIKMHVFKTLKSTKFHQKFLGKIIAVDSNVTTGVVLINIDSTQMIDIDDVLYVSVKLNEIQKPLNPHQFDYNAYMKRQQVYHQVYLNNQNSLVLSKYQTLYGRANDIRKQINTTLKSNSISKENLSVINALLLGQRQEVSKNTYKSFTSSGAVHILAISGLHIGLLLLILTVLFKPITYFKHGKIIVSITIVMLLWTYTFIVGMSASVVRAVTMFSLFTFAIYSNRITNTYNTLVISAFLLLLWNPYYIFDIGFQMSYSAVFAIIWIKPLFDNLWRPKFYISRKLWDVFSVTLSAQFGILPLSLFYFHQFPGLFFITNIVIIPLLGFLLGLGIITLIFAYLGWIPELLFQFFDQCISLLLNFVQLISTQEDFIFYELPFNTWNLITSFLFIISVILFWKAQSFKRLMYVLLSIVCVQLAFIRNEWHSQSEEFIVFNQYKTTFIGEKSGRQFRYSAENLKYTNSIDTYVVNEFIQSVERDSLKNVYKFKKKNILIVDNKGIYDTSFKPDIIVLTASPKVNLERLISVVNPELIVIDNNNYKSYVSRWEETCLQNKIPFHHTKEQGAFVLR